MKKNLFIAILFVFSAVASQAQVIQGTSNTNNGISTGDVRFGAKAGFALSTFLGRDYIEITPKPGFYIGGVAEIPAFFDKFYLQPEVMIQYQGAGIGGDEDLNLLYLHLPIVGKYHITEEIAVEFGPQIGVLLGDNWDEDLNTVNTKRLNFGLNFGGGYRLDESFYFNLRLSPGFTNVIESTNTKNFAFQVGANYFF